MREVGTGAFTVPPQAPTAKIVRDSGSPTTPTNAITYLSDNFWELTLTATEMQAEVIRGLVQEAGSEPYLFEIEPKRQFPINFHQLVIDGAGNLTAGITGNITGNLSGSVGSVTGAVGSVTGAVGSVTGNVGGNVVGSVGSVAGAIASVTTVTGNVNGNVNGNVVGNLQGDLIGNLRGRVLGTGATAFVGVGVLANNAMDDTIPSSTDTGELGTQIGQIPANVWTAFNAVQLAKFGNIDTLLDPEAVLPFSVIGMAKALNQVIEVTGSTIVANLEETRS